MTPNEKSYLAWAIMATVVAIFAIIAGLLTNRSRIIMEKKRDKLLIEKHRLEERNAFLHYALHEARPVSVLKSELSGGMSLVGIFLKVLPEDHAEGGKWELMDQPDYAELNSRDAITVYVDNRHLLERSEQLTSRAETLQKEADENRSWRDLFLLIKERKSVCEA